MNKAPRWEELVGGIGPTKPLVYATAKARRRRKPKAKPIVVRDTPPPPTIRELISAMGRWSRLSCWWLFGARVLALLFPETSAFCRPSGRVLIYGFG